MFLPKPSQDAPFRYLFLDLNSYFAAVEQQENPKLRGQPVGVVPMDADSTCLIAASYEAKKFGLKTGTNLGEAKARCPQLRIVPASHAKYVEYHDRVIEAIETVLPVDKVCSIDEVRIRLLESEASQERSLELALSIKRALREQVGECLTASIGLAPNPFLAKVASDLQKPDGLVQLHPDTMGEQLKGLGITDFFGLNRRMAVRLNLAGIYTAEALLNASEAELRAAFGSVVGARWWYLLRGYDLPEEPTKRRALSNSHVLPPEFRTRDKSYQVLLRLVQKASARLRREGLAAKTVSFMVRSAKEKWEADARLAESQDSVRVIEHLARLWKSNKIEHPSQVGVVLSGLVPAASVTPSLFEQDSARTQFVHEIDRLNGRFGRNTILPASVQAAKDTAEERIAFQKVELFDEGSAA